MTKNTNNKFFKYLLTGLFVVLFSIQFKPVQAQELDTGVDLYSTYVWRGVAYSGPSIQPYVEFSSGGFALGAWGSQGIDGSVADGTVGFQEMDLYTGYTFDFGLSLGVTDYWYPGATTPFFEEDSHAFELNGGYTVGDLSLSANYIFAGGGSAGDDVYFELGYSAGGADLFVGGGDGWHSSDGEFDIVNVGIGTSKDIEVTESLTIPLNGSVILNPDTEQLYIVVGVSL
ncbi:TorF family putative porin [Halalkalibaculum sp. DA384]|uniref:TorF family putative porin n=1 Tax=Halalkalibaculum sp. DA384 TaxID=3373606 RepID=UPI0037540278